MFVQSVKYTAKPIFSIKYMDFANIIAANICNAEFYKILIQTNSRY